MIMQSSETIMKACKTHKAEQSDLKAAQNNYKVANNYKEMKHEHNQLSDNLNTCLISCAKSLSCQCSGPLPHISQP